MTEIDFKQFLSKAVCESTRETFATTLSMDIAPVDTQQIETDEKSLFSTIGFTGHIEGSISVCFTESSACKVVSKMLFTEYTEVNSDVCDGIGEIVNMIIGGVKMKSSPNGVTFNISVPTTVAGDHLKILIEPKGTERIFSAFKADGVSLSIILTYKLHDISKDTNEQTPAPSAKIDPLAILKQAAENAKQSDDAKNDDQVSSALDALTKALNTHQKNPS